MTKTENENKLSLKYNEPFIPDFNVKGIYVTAWVAGLEKRRNELIDLVNNTILNSMVIDVKDIRGEISYNSSVELAKEIGANKEKIKDIEALLSILNEHNIHTIARIAVFKDRKLATQKAKYSLNVKEKLENNNQGTRVIEDEVVDVIEDKENDIYIEIKRGRGLIEEQKLKNENYTKINEDNYLITKSKEWLNPINKNVWDYNISLAREAFKLGFDEVQFDYIRYPALGDNVSIHSEKTINKNEIINDFVNYVYKELESYNGKVSIDVFGLTTTLANGMGIGQDFAKLSERASIISPMVYPSHYYPGVFDLEIPEKKPYETVSKSMKDALLKSKNPDLVLRPWLQDFSVNYKYNAKEVIAQIKAVEDLGIKEWLLWNPSSRYNKEALNDLLPSY